MMRGIRGFRWLMVCLVVMAAARQADATDQTDLSIGLKSLPLLTTKIASPATLAIVFDPASPDSKADADGLKSFVDAGLEGPGGVKLVSLMVGIGELAKLSSAKIVVLAKGVNKSAFDAISTAASAAGALSFSADLDCVKSNKCVLGIVSKPSVEIYFSRAAADAAKVGFSPAFAMLAKPI